MTTEKQRAAARENVKKAQQAWQDMSARERAEARPDARERTQPGRGGEGDYFHIGVRDKNNFTTFRTHDVGEEGGLQRVTGQRESGSWDTVKWLVSKDYAHRDGDRLIADEPAARNLFVELGSAPEHVEGDFYSAKPRPDVPEKNKPTEAQKRARKENLEMAREARRKQH